MSQIVQHYGPIHIDVLHKEEMFSPSTEYSESRPFKIFISLLDKWEIGDALTEVLVLDSFKALKKSMESASDNSDDVRLTVSSHYA